MRDPISILPPGLDEIIRDLTALIGDVSTYMEDHEMLTVEQQIRNFLNKSDDTAIRVELIPIQNRLAAWYRGTFATRSNNNTTVIIDQTFAKDKAYMTIVPPRASGRKYKTFEIQNEIKRGQVNYGTDESLLHATLMQYDHDGELYFNVEIARGLEPTVTKPDRVDFHVNYCNKKKLLSLIPMKDFKFSEHMEAVAEAQVVGRLVPAVVGEAGYLVTGKRIDVEESDASEFALDESMKLNAKNQAVMAVRAGHAIVDRGVSKIVPFYEVHGDYDASQGNLMLDGNLLVHGSIKGNVEITADDIFVQGNIEGSVIKARGDVFVYGGIMGRKTGRVHADGSLFAKYLTDVEVEALGDIVIRASVTYCEVTSNGKLVVVSEKGAIVGGKIAAFKGIIAKNIGSDFGTFTETIVGKDFLTRKRITEMTERLTAHKENLQRISELKKKLGKARVDISNLPPAKQDLFIGMLRKEKKTVEHVQSLERNIETIQAALKEFLDASIQVLDCIYPPVRVQIGEAIKDIEESLQDVELYVKNSEIQTRATLK